MEGTNNNLRIIDQYGYVRCRIKPFRVKIIFQFFLVVQYLNIRIIHKSTTKYIIVEP